MNKTLAIQYTYRYYIRPRFIRDTSNVDMSTTLLTNKIDFPICVAPTGAQCYLHWEGEIATARGRFLFYITSSAHQESGYVTSSSTCHVYDKVHKQHTQ